MSEIGRFETVMLALIERGLQKKLAALFVLTTTLFVYSPSTRLNAQTTGSISGTVTDTSGSAMPGAAIQVTNTGTGIAQTTRSDAQGRYRVLDLTVGSYNVQASQSGFSTSVRTEVKLDVGSVLVVDFEMQVGQQATTVSVESQVSQVDTQTTAVSVLVESKELNSLPLNGRNYAQLLTLTPGVTTSPQAQTSFFGNTPKYSIAGGRPQGQGFLLDGQDTTGWWNSGPGSGALGTTLGIDAIAEFQTLTENFSPQFTGTGSVVNAVSKSGTNAIHGTAYEFLRNTALDTRNFFDDTVKAGATAAATPVFRRNQFGGGVGGPIKRNRLFYFVNYEGYRSTQMASGIAVVPDACVHHAVISGLTSTSGCAINTTLSSNAGTATAMQNAMAIYPLPNFISELGGGTGEFLGYTQTIGYENYLLGRIDYHLSDKDSVFGRYQMDRASRNLTGIIPYWPELDLTRDHFVSIGETHVFSANLLNIAHLIYGRPQEDVYQIGSPTVANGVVSPGTLSSPASVLSPGNHPLQMYSSDSASLYYVNEEAGRAYARPDADVNPGSGITVIGGSSVQPFFLIPNRSTFSDDIMRSHGAHSLTAGFSVTREFDEQWQSFNSNPVWTFSNLTSFINGNPVTVTGEVSDNQSPGEVDAAKDYLIWVFGFYVNDQWKATSKLTVTAGLRYSPTTNISFEQHKAENIINMPYGIFVPVSTGTATNPGRKNWDPRIGLAYDPFRDHKTSIRSSIGIFHALILPRDENYDLGPPYVTVTQTATSSVPIQYPLPFSNVPFGSGVFIPTDGSLSLTNFANYQRSKTPYSIQWNFTVQHELFANTLVTVGYVGSRGVNLGVSDDANQPIASLNPATGLETFGVLNKATNSVVANARANPAFSAITEVFSAGNSSYASLPISVTHRFSSNWQLQTSYAWSKCIDESSGIYSTEEGSNSYYDPLDESKDRGLCAYNRSQIFLVSGIYRVPYRKKGFIGQVVNDWQAAGIFNHQTGVPTSVGSIANRAFTGPAASSASSRPDAIAGCKVLTGVSPIQAVNGIPWINSACFSPAPLGTYGDAGRDTIVAPSNLDLDNSLQKSWTLRKRFILQFRAEVFNILNHPSFGSPNTTPFNSAITAAVNPLASGGCKITASNLASCGVAVNASAGRITSTTSSPRQIQLALRITF